MAAEQAPMEEQAAAAVAAVTIAEAPASNKKVQHLVVDSGAIIKGTNLAALAEVRLQYSLMTLVDDR